MKTNDLYPFHTRVSEFAKNKNKVGFYVPYGGGKTYLSLKWWESLNDDRSVLVLVLKSLIHQWGREIEKHIGLPYSLVTGTLRQRMKALGAPAAFFIANYDIVRSDCLLEAFGVSHTRTTDHEGKVLHHFHSLATTCCSFGTVIVDESTTLKEARTQRFRALYQFVKSVPHRVLLTGKPILEKPEEIWSQMMFLDDGEAFGKSFWRFRYTYFLPGPSWDPYTWTLKPGAGELIAQKLNRLWIRVDEKEVLTELPPKRYIKVHFQLSSSVRKRYQQLRKEFSMELLDGTTYETMWSITRAQKMHQLCQGIFYKEDGGYELVHTLKLDWLRENIPLMLQNGPILIWTHFVRLLSLIASILPMPSAIYAGGMELRQREDALAKFQNGEVDVLLLSEKAAQAGLNLQRANQAVFVSTGYWAGARGNAEARCHRLGSEMHESVTYYDLVVEKSIDTVVLEAIDKKLNIAKEILQHIKIGE